VHPPSRSVVAVVIGRVFDNGVVRDCTGPELACAMEHVQEWNKEA